LHFLDCLVGISQFVQTVLQPRNREAGFISFFFKNSFVCIEQFKIDRGSHMIDSAQLILKLSGLLLDAFVNSLEYLYELF